MPHALLRTCLVAIVLILAAPSLFGVPPEAEETFKQKYPGAEVANWELTSDGYWQVTFRLDDVTYRADLTREGEWELTETSIPFDRMPEEVQEAVNRDLEGRAITEIEAIDHAMHGKLYAIWTEHLGMMQSARYREDGVRFSGVLTLRDPQKHYAVMGTSELLGQLAFNLLTIVVFAYFLYYRRHHDHEMLFLLLGFNLFLFPIFLVSNNLTAGIGFTIFALLALVRLRSDPFSKTETAYLLGAVALTFINAQLAERPQIAGAAIVLTTAFVVDHPRLWRNANKIVNLRFKLEKTESLLDREYLRALIARDYRVEVIDLKIQSVQSGEVRLSVIYRELPGRLGGESSSESPPPGKAG